MVSLEVEPSEVPDSEPLPFATSVVSDPSVLALAFDSVLSLSLLDSLSEFASVVVSLSAPAPVLDVDSAPEGVSAVYELSSAFIAGSDEVDESVFDVGSAGSVRSLSSAVTASSLLAGSDEVDVSVLYAGSAGSVGSLTSAATASSLLAGSDVVDESVVDAGSAGG